MSTNREFQELLGRREAAARAYVRGDAAPLLELAAQELPATFFGPGGGLVQGAGEVSGRYERDAALFGPGSETHFEVLHAAASEDVAYWVGYQRASAHLRGETEPRQFDLRVTEIFRREGDEWKLVHRHADALAQGAK